MSSATTSDELLKYLLRGCAAVNAGPNAREIFNEQMEHEYNNGNTQQSVFYQVMMLFQAFDLRYAHELLDGEEQSYSVQQLRDNMNEWERQDFKSNPLMQYAYQQLLEAEKGAAHKKAEAAASSRLKTTNFLHDVRQPAEGIQRITEVCQQLPKEWTILQLCKGPRADTTFSIFSKIRESNASIYLTLLHHVRTAEYPAPICIRFVASGEQNLFQKFANIAERFKQNITVDPEQKHSSDFKKKYWQDLNELEANISKILVEFKDFFFPWLCLFNGIPVNASESAEAEFHRESFESVDKFCDEHQWEAYERVLLSLAALHIKSLCMSEMEAISATLAPDESQQAAVMMLLLNLQLSTNTSVVLERPKSSPANETQKHYPCILIVDERLDHFYWETLNVNQEFSRVSSLHSLWRLQQCYKNRIRNGYLLMNIESGGCVLNPDDNLANTEMRMKSFLKYWTPHWEIKCRQKLTTDDLCKDIFKRNCFVYAGHGSGLQYFNCKQLIQQQMNGVVFLFGCDSSRLRSCGLYSELTGAHRYYHAALCPAVVGTLLPGLDGNMDAIAAQILSHWIAPNSKNILPWHEIEPRPWAKEGIIKAKTKTHQQQQQPAATMANTPDYHVGSLCEIIARVHQRRFDGKLYNCIGYVCRGLPVWNCNVQSPPQ